MTLGPSFGLCSLFPSSFLGLCSMIDWLSGSCQSHLLGRPALPLGPGAWVVNWPWGCSWSPCVISPQSPGCRMAWKWCFIETHFGWTMEVCAAGRNGCQPGSRLVCENPEEIWRGLWLPILCLSMTKPWYLTDTRESLCFLPFVELEAFHSLSTQILTHLSCDTQICHVLLRTQVGWEVRGPTLIEEAVGGLEGTTGQCSLSPAQSGTHTQHHKQQLQPWEFRFAFLCWASFPVFVGHLCIFSGEMPIQLLCLFF